MDRCAICKTDEARERRFRDAPTFLCDRCHKLAKRRFNPFRGRGKRQVPVPTRKEWIEALAKAWNPASACFECQIAGVPLDLVNTNSPRYLTLEHAHPQHAEGGWLIVAAAINDMKSDFSLGEFRQAIPLLDACMRGRRDRRTADHLRRLLDSLEHWRRR